jgi:hypothetical protein
MLCALQRDRMSIVYTQNSAVRQQVHKARQCWTRTAAFATVLDSLIMLDTLTTSVSRAAKPCCGIAMQQSQYAALSASAHTVCARHYYRSTLPIAVVYTTHSVHTALYTPFSSFSA